MSNRPYLLERVADAAIVQLYADGFDALPLREKILVWHLYQAALAGRDIYYDQRYAHNLEMRETLEALLTHADGIDADTAAEIARYTKLFWINTGPFNYLTARKFVLRVTPDAFARAVHAALAHGATLPLREAETVDAFIARVAPLFLDPAVDTTVTNKTPGEGRDILQSSANNLYQGVKMEDLTGFTEQYELNSRLVMRDGQLVEEVYRLGGKYSDSIARIIGHLTDALPYASDQMAGALRALIRFYETGSPDDRRAYDIAWVNDQSSSVDTINGFVEVYMDARGCKGAWEALVYYINDEKTRHIQAIAEHAQWFEDHMPWEPRYRKPSVTGVTARAIDVVIESGEAGPLTAIGINLPNDQEIRERFGSKSVSLSNVIFAYDKSVSPEMRSEFCWSEDEVARAERWNSFASELATNLHEVIGHGSGLVSARLNGAPQQFLKEQYSALEETRADLVALYFIADPKMVELGLVQPDAHADVVLAEYEGYARNALVQLRRVREGTQIEEDHMRNRQTIVHWLMANTTAVERRRRNEKTYYVMVDTDAFRDGVGRLLAEVQRIKAEGDYAAAIRLFDTYGIHFDAALRDEIVARTDALNLPAYSAFVQPRLDPVYDAAGDITEVRISYPCDFAAQMLEYSANTARPRPHDAQLRPV